MLLTVVVLLVYFATWAAIHSLLASRAVKDWARRLFGGADRWLRLAYNIIAVLTLGPLLLLVLYLPDRLLYVVPAPWRYVMLAVEGLALLGIAGTLLQTGLLRFAGLTQLFERPAQEAGGLQWRGFYCWVRHPLYALGLLVIWLLPVMTVSFLTLIVATTIYLYVGSLFEERRLLAEFGAAYRGYQRQIPRFIPRPGRCYEPGDSDQQLAVGDQP